MDSIPVEQSESTSGGVAVIQREMRFQQASRDDAGDRIAFCVQDFDDRIERRSETLRFDLDRQALSFARLEAVEIFDWAIGKPSGGIICNRTVWTGLRCARPVNN